MPVRTAGRPTNRSPGCAMSSANRLRYVFRHRPIAGSDLARRAAELAERAEDPETVLARAYRIDDALGDVDRGRPPRRRQRPGPRARRPRRGRAGGPAREGAGRGRREERARERRDDHADLLHQRPPLRRTLGRELACRRDARHARSPHALGRARLRQLGSVRGHIAAVGDVARGGLDQFAARGGLRRVLAAGLRRRARRCRASGCRCSIGSTTAC